MPKVKGYGKAGSKFVPKKNDHKKETMREILDRMKPQVDKETKQAL